MRSGKKMRLNGTVRNPKKLSKILQKGLMAGLALLLSQCATVREVVPFMESDTTLSARDFWKKNSELNNAPHDVSGTGFIQIEAPALAAKVRANYRYSSAGVARVELSTLITGDLATIYLNGDSAIVNDYLNRQSFADATTNLEFSGLGTLAIGDWNLNTLFLGLVHLEKKKWKFSKKPSPKLYRLNEEITLDASGRVRSWQVREEWSDRIMRQLDLEYETPTAQFPVVITLSDFDLTRKLKFTHQNVVWDDPIFQVRPVKPEFSPIFQFSTLRDH